MFPWWGIYPMMKPIPTIDEQPPTLYYMLRAILDDEEIKTSKLAEIGRNYIFDFDYPLTSNISKKDFETMILNKFLFRRIGTQTLTSFKINLSVKLNEIMPMYNKLFDAIEYWNIFEDGEEISRTLEDNKISTSENNINNTNLSKSVSDRRYSDTPQNRLSDIENGTYMTDYNLDNNTSNDNSTSHGNASSNDNTNVTENIKRTPADKINIYKQFIESKNNIYTMIFKDLDSLFYQLV